MSLFQLFATLFAMWMIFSITVHSRRKLFSIHEFWMWISLWILFIVIAIFPDLLMGISNRLNFSRVFDLLVVFAFIILTTMVFVSYFNQQELKKKLNDLVSELATRDGIKFLDDSAKKSKGK